MKKIFLTSGIVLCMACPAFAATDINYTQPNPATETPGSYSAANCTEPTLGNFTGPTTFNAKWEKNTYTIQYAPGTARNLTGTNESPYIHTPSLATGLILGTDDRQTATYDESSVLKQGSIYAAPAGYEFVEWKADYVATTGAASPYTDATHAGGTSYAAGATINPYKVDGTLTLTALWAPLNYTVTYDKNNHAANGVSNYTHTNGAQMDKNYTALTGGGANAAASTTGIYAAPGYTFRGWSRSAGSTYTGTEADTWVWTGETPYTEADNLTVYAIYSANQYTLTYSCGSYTDTEHSVGPKNASAVADSYLATAANVTRTYTFDASGATAQTPATVCELAGYHVKTNEGDSSNWHCTVTNGDTTTDVLYSNVTSQNWSVVGNVECHLEWEPNEITVAWQAGGNATTTGEGGDNQCTYDLGLNVQTAPTRTGYTFKGWTTDTSAAADANYVIFNAQGQPSITQ